MLIEKIEVMHLKLPFKNAFVHSLKSRDSTDNIIVRVHSGKHFGIGESLPRDYVTGETIDSVFSVLKYRMIPDFTKNDFIDFESLLEFISSYSKTLKKDELSAFAALETAILNLACKEFGKKIEDVFTILNIGFKKKNFVSYSAIIGVGSIISTIGKIFYVRKASDVKVKISKKSIHNLYLMNLIKSKNIRLDANGDFDRRSIISLIEKMNILGIKYVEQPSLTEPEETYNILKKNGIKVILDESVCTFSDLQNLEKMGDLVNLRISKNGGIVATLLMYKWMKERKKDVVLGCLVGETVLTRYNLILANHLDCVFYEGDYDRFLFKKRIFSNPSFDNAGKIIVNKNMDFNEDIFDYEQYLVKKEVIDGRNNNKKGFREYPS